MARDHVERPIFAEGQYLGAADLTAAVDHGRVHAARHLLAAHTWGIALGLDLEERPSPATGEIEVFLRPGYAWDGFGRPVIVLAPCRIPAAALRAATCPAVGGGANGCLIDVWLRYREEATAGPRPGFEDCNGDGRFGRVRETFAIEIGPRSATSQQDPIDVAGQPRPARDALKVHDPVLTLHDESVPYQTLPVPASATWLIPVGQVRWQPGAGGQPGRFVARDPADLAASAAVRRFVGIVAEGLQAAGDSLRLRKRTVPPRTEPSDDLVWVEGSLRAHGHARLWGGKLEFREQDGRGSGDAADAIPALRLQATPAGAGAARTLQIALGPDSASDNALAIGPLLAGNPDAIVERVVVRSGGNVGIGTPPRPSYSTSARTAPPRPRRSSRTGQAGRARRPRSSRGRPTSAPSSSGSSAAATRRSARSCRAPPTSPPSRGRPRSPSTTRAPGRSRSTPTTGTSGCGSPPSAGSASGPRHRPISCTSRVAACG